MHRSYSCELLSVTMPCIADAILTANKRRSGMGEQDYVALCQEMYTETHSKPFCFLVSFIELDRCACIQEYA
jgi:hypothetical protein